MLRALLYLRLMTAGNWLLSRARRLREPKYLLGAAAGAAYFHYLFLRPLTRGTTAHPDLAALPPELLSTVAALAALGMFVLVALAWLVTTSPASLGFTEAEIAFLFPAPLPRPALVHFRLLSAQLRSLLAAAAMTLISQRWSAAGGHAATHAVGWWLVFSTLGLHRQGAGFALAGLEARGFPATRIRLLIGAGLGGVLLATWLRLPSLPPEAPDRGLADTLGLLAGTAPLGWLLAPLGWLAGPFLAADLPSFLLALAPALAVAGLHYLWVARTAGRFEETELGHAQSRAAQVAAWRAGRGRLGPTTPRARKEPFTLSSPGRPELAFLWKNLLSTWSCFRPRVFAAVAAVLTLGLLAARHAPGLAGLLPGIGAFAAILAGYTLVVGPQFARQDLRTDLAHADVLKTYPLAGWQVVAGQLLAPLAILTGLLWLELLVASLALPPLNPGGPWSGGAVRTALTLGAAAVIPPLALLQLLVPNSAALLFPAWQQASRTSGGGLEMVGIRMIFFLAQFAGMVAALLPAALMAGSLLLIGRWLGLWLPGTLLAATLSAVLVLAAEAVIGLAWLGRRFEAYDLTEGPERPG